MTGVSILIALSSTLLFLYNSGYIEEWFNKRAFQYLEKQTGLNITYQNSTWAKALSKGVFYLKNVTVIRPEPVPPQENWCIFELSIDKIRLKISPLWFILGRGWVKEMKVQGVRGVVDRRTEWKDPSWKPRNWPIFWGDFHFTNVVVQDCHFTLYFPEASQRAVSVFIEVLKCPRIRRRYLLYDVICSTRIDGVFDGCRLAYRELHPERQNEGREMMLRIYGLGVDLLSKNASGPLGWMTEGEMDMEVQVMLPTDVERVNNIHFNFFTRLNRVVLSPSLFDQEIDYISNAIALPIARYFNAYKRSIQLSSQMQLPKEHFDRSWSLADIEFWDAMSEAISDSLTDVYNKNRPTSIKEWWQYIWKTITA
ncbi:mitochondrial inner membrane protein Mdm31 (predicted) [Planoprotostelium fungivorum]|uniref:Mitochondrial inner membrane protein Mdm31 (Predicted) n=1 Tax=Planoprotostelium fungivorum TaxID=1890364 RepID=A0A2P6NEN6_9EUKA|nr:mitochondrial inner membrane protein Mdm31 (predicted) [Planoprotostelium fungivorum]